MVFCIRKWDLLLKLGDRRGTGLGSGDHEYNEFVFVILNC